MYGCSLAQEQTIDTESSLTINENNDSKNTNTLHPTVEKKINSRGNSSENLLHGGFASIQDEWIYYLKESYGYQVDGELYRINIENGNKERISDDAACYINVIEDWVYYVNTEESENGIYWEGPIYKIKVDGTNRIKLNTDDSTFVNVVDDMIYYANVADNYTIYSMKTDGTQVTKLNDDRSWSLNVTDNWIYYTSNREIYKMKLDGSNKSLILSDNVSGTHVTGNYIFYYQGDEGSLFRINLDGSEKTQITEDVTSNFSVLDNHIYYSIKEVAYEDGFKLDYVYRIDIDGKNREKIGQGAVGSIVGDWMYFYQHYAEWAELERMKLDGSQREKVE